MHFEIIDKDRFELLKKITENVSIPNYYMVGGTGLSLQLGLRESVEYNWDEIKRFFVKFQAEFYNVLENLGM